jgi:beta-glucanase (GH16 family)
VSRISARPKTGASTATRTTSGRNRLVSLLAVVALASTALMVASPADAGQAYAERVARPTKPPTTPTTPTAPISDACGPLVAKTATTSWNCTFVDNFDGTSLDRTKWTVITTANSGFRNGPECYVDSPNNIAVGSGVLTLTARQVAPMTCQAPSGAFTTSYTGASLYGTFGQAYGRYEVSAAFPTTKVAGVHSALWMWPKNQAKYGPWPYSGEIDMAEFYSKYPDRAIPYIHYVESNPYDTSVTNNYCLIKDPTQFHTYVVEWTTTRIKISYDGRTCVDHAISPAAPLTGSAPFDQPFAVALTQALGIGANAFNSATTPLPASTRIDYVKIWS